MTLLDVDREELSMRTYLRRLSGALALGLAAGLLVAPLDAAAKGNGHRHDQVPITLRAASVTGQVRGGGTFAGTLALTELGLDDSGLVAAGTVDGALTDAAGTTHSVTGDVQLPLQITGCQAPTVSLTFPEPLAADTPDADPLVDLSPGATATISAPNGADANAVALLGVLLCQVPGLQGSPDLLGRVLDLINDLL
jgi:hypothetical protein